MTGQWGIRGKSVISRMFLAKRWSRPGIAGPAPSFRPAFQRLAVQLRNFRPAFQAKAEQLHFPPILQPCRRPCAQQVYIGCFRRGVFPAKRVQGVPFWPAAKIGTPCIILVFVFLPFSCGLLLATGEGEGGWGPSASGSSASPPKIRRLPQAASHIRSTCHVSRSRSCVSSNVAPAVRTLNRCRSTRALPAAPHLGAARLHRAHVVPLPAPHEGLGEKPVLLAGHRHQLVNAPSAHRCHITTPANSPALRP